MEKEPAIVRVLFVGQYKEGQKSLIKFVIQSNETKNSRGYFIIDQWIDGNIPFMKITNEYIDEPLEAIVDYRQTYGANAVLHLTELYDENGNNLLA